jgi:hypothetical protein
MAEVLVFEAAMQIPASLSEAVDFRHLTAFSSSLQDLHSDREKLCTGASLL